jgi:nucleotide-binding universal stress UspA family protein
MTETKTIVVGVDGSPGAVAALRFAVEEARTHGKRLHVVHAWRMPLSLVTAEPAAFGVPMVPDLAIDEVRGSALAEAAAVLDAALESVDTSGVEVERELVEAPPARALIEAAQGAELLVVGSRGHGGFTGLLLGSVSQQCTHHAPCPVVIVPQGES